MVFFIWVPMSFTYLSKKIWWHTDFGKKSGISRQIRAKINISVTKSQFPENHEKCNNSSPNCLNKLIFGHKLLLRGPQQVYIEFSKFWVFAPFLAILGSKLAFLADFRAILVRNGKYFCQISLCLKFFFAKFWC